MIEPPNALATMLADLATRVSNTALNADPALQGRLTKLHGNVVEFNCLTPAIMPTQVWHFTIVDDNLLFRHGPADRPHVVVTGQAPDLANWVFNGRGSQIQIDGDEVLLAQLQEIFTQFSPDFAEPLQKIIGPGAAQSLLSTAELGLSGIRSAIEGFGHAISGTAASNTVSEPQLEGVLKSIDELRLKVDQLSAQVKAQQDTPRSSEES